jgi:hypothetical protein
MHCLQIPCYQRMSWVFEDQHVQEELIIRIIWGNCFGVYFEMWIKIRFQKIGKKACFLYVFLSIDKKNLKMCKRHGWNFWLCELILKNELIFVFWVENIWFLINYSVSNSTLFLSTILTSTTKKYTERCKVLLNFRIF